MLLFISLDREFNNILNGLSQYSYSHLKKKQRLCQMDNVTNMIYMPKIHNLKIKTYSFRDLSPKSSILEKINFFHNFAIHCI